jgi:aminodeoxychorismate lyase
MHVMLNNRLIPAEKASIPLSDRGFRYGDGVFETIPVYAGIPYQFDWHMARLQRGLAAIKITCDTSPLREQCRELLEKNKVQDGLLRIQVTRGEGGRGYLPDPNAKPTSVIETLTMPEVPREPVALWLSGYEKISPKALPVTSKLGSALNSVLARLEAVEHHCAEALLLNSQGHITETGASNIFWLKNNLLYTPALTAGLLEGATRAAVLRLSPYKTKEVESGLESLKEADAVFLTNVVLRAFPVGALSPLGYGWHSEAVADQFNALLTEDIALAIQRGFR